MEFYTESINPDIKEKIREWAKLANITYNIGVIKSCEAVLFQDILTNEMYMQISDKENEVSLSQDIIDYLSNGDSPLVLTHNHSGKETCFSNRDIEVLIDYPRIVFIIVINSKQEIYILGKTQQTKSGEEVMRLFWDWWSTSEKNAIKLKTQTTMILVHSPSAIHADREEFEKLMKIEDEVIIALHNMTNHDTFLKFASKAGFYGAYLYN